MKCEQCGYYTNVSMVNGIGHGYCKVNMGLKQSVDGCTEGVEEIRDMSLYGFDNEERLVRV